MQKVSRSILTGLLLVAGITACGDKVSVAPNQTTTETTTVTSTATQTGVVHSVSVQPQSVSLGIGGQVQLVATVDADAGLARTVTWATTDSTKATVTAAGLVTAVKSGTVVITATSTADTHVSGAATIIITPVTNAQVTISSINSNATNAPVNLAAVNGQVDVVLNVDPGTQTVTSVDLLVDSTVAASQTFSVSNKAPVTGANKNVQQITLSVNTAAFNATSGVASYMNGAHTISARANVAGGSPAATNTTATTFTNADVVNLTQSWTANALDATGLKWYGGADTVMIVPVMYTPGRSIASVTVSNNTNVTTKTTTTLPGTVVFPTSGTGNIGAISNAAFTITESSVDNAGSAGPATTTTAIRMDNVSPALPTLFQVAGGAVPWVNGSYTFGNTTDYTAGSDGAAGTAVGGVTTTFYAIPLASYTALTGSTGAACVSAGTAVAKGSDAAQSAPGDTTTYKLRAIEKDKLGNAACVDMAYHAGATTTFGVDFGNPITSLASTSPANGKVYGIGSAVGAYTWVLQDSVSGFGATPIMGNIVKNYANTAAGCVTGTWDGVHKVCTNVALAGGMAADAGTAVGTNGYYTMNSVVSDQAGNSVTLPGNTILHDVTAPVAAVGGGVSIPAAVGGSAVTYVANDTDDVDLVGANGAVVYGGLAIRYPATISPSHAAFSGSLNQNGAVSVSIASFISNMQVTTGGNAPPGVLGAAPSDVFARGVDGAGNSGGKDIVLTGTGTVSDGTSPTVWVTGVSGFSTFAENNAAGDGPISNGTGTGARSFTLKAQVVGAGVGVGVPFNTVCWYYQDLASATNPAGTGDYVQIGCQNLAVSTLVGGTYTWDWTGPTFDPPANLGTGATNLNIIAIGMGNGGSALQTQINSTVVLAN